MRNHNHNHNRRKSKSIPSQSNTMLQYLPSQKNKAKSLSTEPQQTQCSSPPPPAVLMEKSFERHKLALMQNSAEQDMVPTPIKSPIKQRNSSQSIPPLHNHAIFAIKDKNIMRNISDNDNMSNNIQSIDDDEDEDINGDNNGFSKLDAFSFQNRKKKGNSNMNRNGNRNRNTNQNKAKKPNINGKNDAIVIIDDEEEEKEIEEGDTNQYGVALGAGMDTMELSQTQQIDSISDRHQQKRLLTQTTYHKFKRVVPKKRDTTKKEIPNQS